MTIQDKSLTLLGASAVVTQVDLWPQADGSTSVQVSGSTLDSLGRLQALDPVRFTIPAGNGAIATMMATATTRLRIANGLEV